MSWQPMNEAPCDGTWVIGKLSDGRVVVMHWAEDLSGEEQPPFRGWFKSCGSYMAGVDPVAWRPVSAMDRIAKEVDKAGLYDAEDKR